jgi:hypothetical protein
MKNMVSGKVIVSVPANESGNESETRSLSDEANEVECGSKHAELAKTPLPGEGAEFGNAESSSPSNDTELLRAVCAIARRQE